MIISIISLALIWFVLGLITNFMGGFNLGYHQQVRTTYLSNCIYVLFSWVLFAPRVWGNFGGFLRKSIEEE